MCGRKTLTRDMQSIIEELAIQEWEEADNYVPSYNIAPTQSSPILLFTGHNTLRSMRWGLIPFWTKDISSGAKMINARAETLLEKPSFRSLVTRNRCLAVTDGYYEWKKITGRKQPYYIHHPQGHLLTMAGLWDRWTVPDGSTLYSYTVITTAPAADLAHIHDRMPVILLPEDREAWLRTDRVLFPELRSRLQPYPEELEAYPVSTLVNSPAHNSPDCIQPLN